MGFKRYALRVRKDVEEMENMLFDLAKGYIVSFSHPDIYETSSLILQQKLGSTTSLVARLLESHTHDGQVSYQDIQEIKGAASVLYAGEFVSFPMHSLKQLTCRCAQPLLIPCVYLLKLHVLPKKWLDFTASPKL